MASSSSSLVDVGYCYVNLLGRSYKNTPCYADETFVDNVKKQQKDHLEMLKRRQQIPEDEQNSQADSPPSRDVQPKLRDHPCTGGVESDGGCFSRSKKKKSKGNDESSSDNETAESSEEMNLLASKSTMSETLSILADDNHHETGQEPRALGNPDTGEAVNSGDLEMEQGNVEAVVNPNDYDQECPDSVDHASEDDMSEEDSRHLPPTSVSSKIDIDLYSESEWKGTTYAAQCMRLGYKKVMEATGCGGMRKIRGDNYCGLRATSFQLLSQNLKCLIHLPNLKYVLSFYDTLSKCEWLSQWSFAGRLDLPMPHNDAIKKCLRMLYELIEMSRSITDDEERVKYFLDLFNSGSDDEIMFFEALKLLMLHSAIELLEMENMPEFAYLLFARDTSETPEKFMMNHLNTVGDTGGLEQVVYCMILFFDPFFESFNNIS